MLKHGKWPWWCHVREWFTFKTPSMTAPQAPSTAGTGRVLNRSGWAPRTSAPAGGSSHLIYLHSACNTYWWNWYWPEGSRWLGWRKIIRDCIAWQARSLQPWEIPGLNLAVFTRLFTSLTRSLKAKPLRANNHPAWNGILDETKLRGIPTTAELAPKKIRRHDCLANSSKKEEEKRCYSKGCNSIPLTVIA